MLEAIAVDKRALVRRRMAQRPLATFRGSLEPSTRSLFRALSQPRTGFILECKKASPSQGLIRTSFDPRAIAKSYAPFCDAVSVLTDEKYFQGCFEHLRAVRETVAAPVLCKDFVVSPYQLYEARSHGADAILLMCALLDDSSLLMCLSVCRELDMDALVEVHDEAELHRAIRLDARIIGINNRDLRTLHVDLATTARLAPMVPADRLIVCESGIEHHATVRHLRPLCDAFLVGTSLMQQASLDDAVRRLIFGRVKICGLTRREQACAAREAGATYGGLLFWPNSARALTLDAARAIRRELDLRWVGVFVDADPDEVAIAARELALDAVQLHGHEGREYAAALRPRLPEQCALWKAARVGDPHRRPPDDPQSLGVDRLLFDAYLQDQPGGTATRFDWSLVRDHPRKDELILSGGICPQNASEADALGCWALDLSSGVESSSGIKDRARIQALFDALRG